MLYLRAADARDAAALAGLRAASLLELGLLARDDAAAFAPRAAAATLALFRRGELQAWIACHGEAVVGSACVVLYDRLPYPDGTRHAEIAGVYVAPPYRGHGIAAELVREAVDAARGSGARGIFLAPSPGTEALYARLGFEAAPAMRLAAGTALAPSSSSSAARNASTSSSVV